MKKLQNPFFILHNILYVPIKLCWEYKLSRQTGHEAINWFDDKSLIKKYEILISHVAKAGCKLRSWSWSSKNKWDFHFE